MKAFTWTLSGACWHIHIFVFGLLLALGGRAYAGTSDFAIGGRIVRADQIVPYGWIVIRNGKIVSISPERPKTPGIRFLATNDTIYPGLVDLHNHTPFNILPTWTPNQYRNRYAWRNEAMHERVVGLARDMSRNDFCEVNQFAELRALLGGTTTVLGTPSPPPFAQFVQRTLASGIDAGRYVKHWVAGAQDPFRPTPTYAHCIAGLARNLDWENAFDGQSRVRARALNGLDADSLKMRDQLGKGNLELLAVHLAEGKKSDPESQQEFGALVAAGMLTRNTAIVHGIALAEGDFKQMASAGTALIWSPRSNVALYGETADVRGALRAGVRVVLAPDWALTGSATLLGEIQWAYKYSQQSLGGAISPRALFDMASSSAARVAGSAPNIGELAEGRQADFFVVSGMNYQPFEALMTISPRQISMVVVNGIPIVGIPEYVKQLGVSDVEPLSVCGSARVLNSSAMPIAPFSALQRKLDLTLRARGSQLPELVDCP